ncbi:MAG: geranylgeranyl reductase family protein [Thermoplasmata archaeon]
MEEYEVAVIGAGPAGASAARELERLGVDYILMDRCSFPRSKPCAGILPPKIEELVGPLPRTVYERRIWGYHLHTASGAEFLSRFPRPGYSVDRSRFDSWLLSRLKKQPVRAEMLGASQGRDSVTVRTNTGELKCRVLIGADGANSRVRAVLDAAPGAMALACQTSIPMPPSEVRRRTQGWFHVFYIIPGGYGWVAPHRSCVRAGVGSTLSGWGAPKSLSIFLRMSKVRELTGDGECMGFEAHRIPMGGPLPILGKGRVLLAGDAGGFVFPGTGEGVRFALLSGTLAARAASLCLERGPGIRRIDRTYLKLLEEEGLLSLREVDFRRVLRSPASAERYVTALRGLSGSAC